MSCSAIAAIAGAVTLTLTGNHHPQGVKDRVVLAPHESYAAQVCYANSDAQLSVHGFHTITMDGLTVTVFVEVGGQETITVIPPPGYWVFPTDSAVQSIHDGEEAVFYILEGVG